MSNRKVTASPSSAPSGVNNPYERDLQLPAFWASCPENWFNVVDELFRLRGIDSQEIRFAMASRALPDDVVGKVSDIFGSFPEVDRYDVLKRTLIERLQVSQVEKYETLFDDVEFVGLTPEEMFRKMRALAGPQAQDDNLLRRMWFNRLNEQIKLQLQGSIDTGDLPTLVRWANSLHSIQKAEARKQRRVTSATCSVATTSAEDPRDRRIAELEAAVARLTMGHNQPSQGDNNVCWYHQTFKNAATKCRPPCKYHKPFKKKQTKKNGTSTGNAPAVV